MSLDVQREETGVVGPMVLGLAQVPADGGGPAMSGGVAQDQGVEVVVLHRGAGHRQGLQRELQGRQQGKHAGQDVGEGAPHGQKLK